MATVTKRRGPGRDTTSATSIATAERHAGWLQSRKQGKPYREIAREAGVAVSVVHEAVSKQVRAIREEPAAELRSLEREALEDLITKACDALDGAEDPLPVIEQIRKLRADLRKLLGVDAPTKVEVGTPPREQLWDRVRAWLKDPTPELLQVLAECGWTRKGKR